MPVSWPASLPNPRPRLYAQQREPGVAETQQDGGPPRRRFEFAGQPTKLPQEFLMTGTQVRALRAFIDNRISYTATPFTMPIWTGDAYVTKLVQLLKDPKYSYHSPRYTVVTLEMFVLDQMGNAADDALADYVWNEGVALYSVPWLGTPGQDYRTFTPPRQDGEWSKVYGTVVKILEAFNGTGTQLLSPGGINDDPAVSPDYIVRYDMAGLVAGTTVFIDSAHADAGNVVTGGGAPGANADALLFEDQNGDATTGKASLAMCYEP